jgi:hypothetical protein
MSNHARRPALFLGIVSLVFQASGPVNAQSPSMPPQRPPMARPQVADDESPFADELSESNEGEFGAPLEEPDNALIPEGPQSPALPLPLQSQPGIAPLGPAGASNANGLSGATGLTGLSASLGTTRGSYSAAPNMIGDLFNSGTSSLNFQAQFVVQPTFSNMGPNAGGLVIPDANSLFNGINAPIDGVSVTSLSNIGDLVRTGDSSFISPADLAPINSVNVRVNSLTEADDVLAGSSAIRPAAPTSNSLIFEAANRAVAREFSSSFSSEVAVEEFVELEYLEGESSIFADQGEIIEANYVYNASVSLPVPSPGEVVGRYSIADNNSPLPQDRLFLDYNFFHNARITAAGIPVNRWAPGFESTFADGLGSFEFRAPMAVTLTSAINTNGDDLAALEFGDISFTFKGLLHQDDRFIASMGVGVTVPTADDFSLTLENNVQVVRVKNQSVHILPFIAGSISITRNTFVQSFTQFDFDTNGNSVFLNEEGFLMQGSGRLENVGRLKSQSTIRFSNSAGGFLFRNRSGRVSDLAAVLEAHYTGTLNRSDAVGSANFAVGDPTRTLSVLNLTSGLHAYMGKSVVTAAYGVPVTEDRVFDGELRLFINRYF